MMEGKSDETRQIADEFINQDLSERSAGSIFVRRLEQDELDQAVGLTRNAIAAVGSDRSMVKRMFNHNPDQFWGVYRHDEGGGESLVGCYSFLLLNARGAAALLNRTLSLSEPPLHMVTPNGERPHLVYIWSIVAKGLSGIASPMVIAALGRTCSGLPIYTSAGTQAGLNLMRKQGFAPVTENDDVIGGLFFFAARGELKMRPGRAHRMESRFKTVVVSTPDEMEKARAIRALFVVEQKCPYDEEFDGNDFSCTHILGYVEGEPAATLRIRYFADFVKMERLAVLPRFRRTLIAEEIVLSSINFCQRKGYTKIYGHAQKRFVKFWSRFGFMPTGRNEPLVFSDFEYVEMYGEVAPHKNPITMQSDPYLLIRPEGRWDEPGVLDKSAVRPPTNPH